MSLYSRKSPFPATPWLQITLSESYALAKIIMTEFTRCVYLAVMLELNVDFLGPLPGYLGELVMDDEPRDSEEQIWTHMLYISEYVRSPEIMERFDDSSRSVCDAIGKLEHDVNIPVTPPAESELVVSFFNNLLPELMFAIGTSKQKPVRCERGKGRSPARSEFTTCANEQMSHSFC